jgi:DNA-binding NarL/FixJ family response regulator
VASGGAILRVPVLVLTTYDTDADIVRAVEAGATGAITQCRGGGRGQAYLRVRMASGDDRREAPSAPSPALG